jgi:hypothetical protein
MTQLGYPRRGRGAGNQWVTRPTGQKQKARDDAGLDRFTDSRLRFNKCRRSGMKDI